MTESSGEAATVPETQDRDFEAEATKQGWRPQGEWTGAPEHWKDAKTYVEHGDLKSQIAKLERTHRAEIDGLKRVGQNTADLLKRQYDADLSAIKEAQKVAAKAGDDQEYDRLESLKQDIKAPEKVAPVDPNAEFQKRNDWYGADEDLTNFAIGVSNTLVSKYREDHKGADMPLDEMIEATEKKVKASKLYQEKFPKTNGHTGTDGGSDEPPPSKADPMGRYSAEIRLTAKEDMKKYPKMYPTAQAWIQTYEGKR